MQEKSFEQKLHSLQVGCIIIGVLQLFSLVSSINNLSEGNGGLGTVILSVLILLDIVFAYYYTSKMNPLGPVLEYVFGVLLIIDGIILCITIILLILGVVFIAVGAGVLKEANWFQKYINDNNNSNKLDDDFNNMQ